MRMQDSFYLVCIFRIFYTNTCFPFFFAGTLNYNETSIELIGSCFAGIGTYEIEATVSTTIKKSKITMQVTIVPMEVPILELR